MKNKRETLASGLGFLLVSAGCAVGLGNVWRFPYVVGEHGGAIFVLVYLIFLFVLGLPLMTMEFAIGRGSRKSLSKGYQELAPQATFFKKISFLHIGGNWLLMMFYTTVSGWMLAYACQALRGTLPARETALLVDHFNTFLLSPLPQVGWMTLTIVIGFIICLGGLRNGVERATKWMMASLFIILIGLATYCMRLPGAEQGLSFYLKPDFSIFKDFNATTEMLFAAVGQAFFTLSIGIGSMTIFGSYTSKDRTLTGESLKIICIDTAVAITAGLIIFPACSAFNIQPDEGPGLVFITLPKVFQSMPWGRLWEILFFIFLALASITTIIAVFENIIAIAMDNRHWSRKRAIAIVAPILWILSLPCALSGYLGFGSHVLDIEDLLVANIALPLGSLIILLFCTSKKAWGWENFLAEVNTGKGIRFPQWSKVYVFWILPLIILSVFVVQLLKKLI